MAHPPHRGVYNDTNANATKSQALAFYNRNVLVPLRQSYMGDAQRNGRLLESVPTGVWCVPARGACPEGPTIKKIQSRSRFSISLEIFNFDRKFNLDVSNSPQKIGRGGWLARKLHSRSKFRIFARNLDFFFDLWALWVLSDPTEIPPPPNRETGVAIPLSHCVSWDIADYRCYTPRTSFRLKMAYRSPKTSLTRGVSQKKLASEAYRAIGGRRTK